MVAGKVSVTIPISPTPIEVRMTPVRRPVPWIVKTASPSESNTNVQSAVVGSEIPRIVVPWIIERVVVVAGGIEWVVVRPPDRTVPCVWTVPVRRVEHLEVAAIPVRMVLGDDRFFVAFFVVVVLGHGDVLSRLVYHNAIGLSLDLVVRELQLRIAAGKTQAQQ